MMYDGTLFHGSQIQGEIPTVQLYLNRTLTTLFRTPIATLGASRTDEGVHALCNYYQFDTEDAIRPDLVYKCNAILPHGISVSKMYAAVNPEFNARFDATMRRYRYRVTTRKNPFLVNRAYFFPFTLDHDLLMQCAAIIKEHTHFESFCKRNNQSKTHTCLISRSEWHFAGDELEYIVEGNRFLRGMVRGLVGTQLKAGRKKISLTDFSGIFAANDSRSAFFNVDGHGLYLEHIAYPEGALVAIQ